MKKGASLAAWLEDGAEGPAYTVALVAMVARGTEAWSAGAVNLQRILGPVGMQLFNGMTSAALAVGAELTMSVGGRQWRRYSHMAIEVQAEKGLTKAQREARRRDYTLRANVSKIAALCGAGLSLYAAFYFLASQIGSGGPAAAALEFFTALAFVLITGFFGVFKDPKEEDPREKARQRGQSIMDRQIDEAAERIAAGQGTPADVRLLHSHLPEEHRAAFLAAHLSDQDEMWKVADIATWLGAQRGTPEWGARTRDIQRVLVNAEKAGEPVARDDHKHYIVPRTVAFRLFAPDYVVAHGRVSRDTLATTLRLVPGRAPVPVGATRDEEATATREQGA